MGLVDRRVRVGVDRVRIRLFQFSYPLALSRLLAEAPKIIHNILREVSITLSFPHHVFSCQPPSPPRLGLRVGTLLIGCNGVGGSSSSRKCAVLPPRIKKGIPANTLPSRPSLVRSCHICYNTLVPVVGDAVKRQSARSRP